MREADEQIHAANPNAPSGVAAYERCKYTQPRVAFVLEQPAPQGVTVRFVQATAEVFGGQAEWWRHTLAGAPERLDLPTDRPRPDVQPAAGREIDIVIDEAQTTALKALSQRHGTTLFMTLLAGWAAVLGRLANQTEVVIGTPATTRARTELEGLVGFFVNTLARGV